MASDIMQQVQEDSRKKKQQGVLDRMNAQPHQQDVGGRASRIRRQDQETDDRLARLDAGKPNEEVLERARRTMPDPTKKDRPGHTTGRPYRKSPEEAEEELRWDEDRFGAKAGTEAFGRALATEYAKIRGLDKPPETIVEKAKEVQEKAVVEEPPPDPDTLDQPGEPGAQRVYRVDSSKDVKGIDLPAMQEHFSNQTGGKELHTVIAPDNAYSGDLLSVNTRLVATDGTEYKALWKRGARTGTKANYDLVSFEEVGAQEPEYKQSARRLAADLRKDGTTTESWEAAKQEVADRGARYRESLQSPDAWKRDIDASRMAEFGDVGDVVGAKDSGFEEQYDADVKFQEEEYGGGSLERDRMLAEIMGQEYQTDPDPVGVEGTITDRNLYEKYYAEAKEKNPSAQKEQLQDAAIKGVMAEQAERAALEAEKFPEPLEAEATETVGGGLGYEKTIEELRQEKADREATAKKKEADQVNAAVEMAKKTGPGGAGTRKQPTDTERAARIAMQVERDTKKDGTIDYTRTSEQEDAEFSPLLDGPEQPTEEEAPPGTASDLYTSLTSEQRLPMERQPQGVNLGAALDGLASKDLGAFNRTFGSTFTPGLGKAGPYAHHFTGREEFVSKLSPELRASMAKELKPLVAENRKSVGAALTENVRDTLFEKWGTEKGHLSEEESIRLGRLAKRISGILQEHAAPASVGGGISKDGMMVINQLLEDAGGDFLHPRAWITGRKVKYMKPTDRRAPLVAAIDHELLGLPGWAGFVDTGKAEQNLRMLGAASEGPPAVLEAGELSFEELLEKAKGIEAPGNSPVEDIIASAVEEKEG